MIEKFFKCQRCGNLIGVLHSSGVPMMCCGEKMEPLVPNTQDASKEKHVPVVKIENDKIHVTIGEIIHPMTEEHHIEWIFLETRKGGQRKILLPTEMPEATFYLGKDDPIAVYAYCNLHGLWITKL